MIRTFFKLKTMFNNNLVLEGTLNFVLEDGRVLIATILNIYVTDSHTFFKYMALQASVSYTHLTLPTKA